MDGKGAKRMKKTETTHDDRHAVQWGRRLEDRIGITMYGNKAERFLNELNRAEEDGGFGADTTDAELCGMVTFIDGQGTRKPDSLTVKQVFSWIKWYRKETAAWRRGYREDTPQGFVRMVQAKMRLAPNSEAAWNIMCSPSKFAGAGRDTTTEECRSIESWACSEGILPRGYRPARMWSDEQNTSGAVDGEVTPF
jgi:hypothetical protein